MLAEDLGDVESSGGGEEEEEEGEEEERVEGGFEIHFIFILFLF